MSDTNTDTAPTRPTRRRIPAYVQSFLFLLCGLIIGSGLTLILVRGAAHRLIAEPELLPGRLLQRLDRQLDLDDTQRAAIEPILQARLAAFQAIRQRVKPEFQAELNALRNDVNAVLTPDQQVKWQTRFDTLRERWQ
jgi:hypothetical protein